MLTTEMALNDGVMRKVVCKNCVNPIIDDMRNCEYRQNLESFSKIIKTYLI
jgi:hypothetical protein